jgi:hypothetical protein
VKVGHLHVLPTWLDQIVSRRRGSPESEGHFSRARI